MSSIPLPSALNGAKLGTVTRPDGADTVHLQMVVAANHLQPTTSTIVALAGTVVATALSDANSALVRVNGTYAATLVFEASDDDGTVWVPILCARSDGNTAESTTGALTNNTRAWKVNISGYTQFRVRCTAFTSGTVNVRITPSTLVFDPVPVTAASVSVAALAGTNLIGDVAMGVRTTSTNAALRYKLISVASTNAGTVKASAGRVYGWSFSNLSANWVFVKLFNKATAPVPGTDTPVESIAIPPGREAQFHNMFGVAHASGIGIAVTSGYADMDTGAVAAGDVIGSLLYA